VVFPSQTITAKETTMWFHSLLNSLKPRTSVAGIGRSYRRPTSRPQVEALEDRSLPSAYLQTNLASDIPGQAQFHDPNLVDAWGISLSPITTFWVSGRATDVSTVYTGDVNGSPFVVSPLVVDIPGGRPTGQVFNPINPVNDFLINPPANNTRGIFIFASETGHITAWNPAVGGPPMPSETAFIMASTPGAVYTGLAIHSNPAGSFLYAADFAGGKIDVFDRAYKPTTLSGSFVDPDVPADYDPFNIWNLGGKLYVAYARQEDGDALPDGGHGYVSVFDTNGNLLSHLVGDSHLEEPWGMAIAPANFGEFSNALLVANTASGKINAYDPATGAFLGRLADPNGETIHIDGLWALHFGNGTASGDRNALYFTASGNNHDHGLFGSLRVAPAQVDSMIVNDGHAQRSMVNSLTVTFSDIVTLDPAAFELRKQDGSLVSLTANVSTLGTRTVAVLSFAGPGIIGGSLADGNYTLTIRSDQVHDVFGRALDGDGDGSAGGHRTDALFRLYGDGDGDRDVDWLDRDLFRSAFKKSAGEAGYLWYFDFDGDGDVDGRDNGQFNRRFGQ
jgi:uncharacterized protein (TIGR03118 family)